MTTDILKIRLIDAMQSLAGANRDMIYQHWRGDGDGTDPDVPSVALIRYARDCAIGDDFLGQVIRAILHDAQMPAECGQTGRLDLQTIGDCTVGRDYREQFANLVRGITWTVNAEFCRRQSEKPQENLSGDQTDLFRRDKLQEACESLKHAAECYNAAWQLSTQKVAGKGLSAVIAGRSAVVDCLMQARSVMTDVTYSTWNILEQLLLAMQPVDQTPRALKTAGGSHSNDLTVLYYCDADNRGILGPMQVRLRTSDYPAVVPNPLTFGVTVLDDAMQNSIRAGYRCCRMTLIARGVTTDKLPAVEIIPEFPKNSPQTFGVLEGDSAGGLLAAGMIITADGKTVDCHRTATCAIPECRGGDLMDLSAADLVLKGVGSVPAKMFAVRESKDQLIKRVALVAANKKEWENDPAYRGNPKASEVRSLGDLVTFLRGDTVQEDQLERHASIVYQQWDRFSEARDSNSATATELSQFETHRFDCFVHPRFQVEGPMRHPNGQDVTAAASDDESDSMPARNSDARQMTGERQREEVPGSGDESLLTLLKLSLLSDQDHSWNHNLDWLTPGKSLVLYDRAGAGKTVTTFRICHVLCGPMARETIFDGSAPLVVRIEGSWPADDSGRPLVTLRDMLIRAVAIDFSGVLHPTHEALDEATQVVDYALGERRVVVVVDGFDQFAAGDRQRIQNLMTALRSDGMDGCRWIVASRQHTINEMPELFQDEKWLRVSIEPFTRQQQDDYFLLPDVIPIGGRWLKTIGVPDLAGIDAEHPDHKLADSIRGSMDELLSLPMVLWMIRTLIEGAGTDDRRLPMFQNISELYLLVSHAILKRAVHKSRTEGPQQEQTKFLIQEGKGLVLEEGPQIQLLEHVLSLMAFQMMLLLETNGDINAERYDWFERLCRERFFRTITNRIENEPNRREKKLLEQQEDLQIRQWQWAIKVLKTIELNHQSSVEHHNSAGIAFRSRKMLECYAARYLTCFATAFDIFGTDTPFEKIDANSVENARIPTLYKRPTIGLREDASTADELQTLCAWDFTTEDQWKPTWLLAIDMPLIPPRGADSTIKADPQTMRTSLSALFLQPKPFPGRDIRPTELIYHAWHRFELDDRLLCQRRFWVGGRYFFGQDLPVDPALDSATTERQRQERRAELGRFLLLPDADKLLQRFRRSSEDLVKEIQQQTQEWNKVPATNARDHARFLSKWDQQPGAVKSHTFLQCPPQSWVGPDGNSDACVNVMGDDGHHGDEQPQHRIRVEPYLLQATPVTRGQYALFDSAFVGSMVKASWGGEIADMIGKYSHPKPEYPALEQAAGLYPIIMTSWYDAWAYCKWLGPEYALPSECRHEFGIRGGSTGDYCFGDDTDGSKLKEYAWFGENSDNHAHVVGLKRANAYGLYDVHGQVWEWSWDWMENSWYGQRVVGKSRGEIVIEDTGPASGSVRSLRGSSFVGLYFRVYARSSFRFDFTPDYRNHGIGFRCSRAVYSPQSSSSPSDALSSDL